MYTYHWMQCDALSIFFADKAQVHPGGWCFDTQNLAKHCREPTAHLHDNNSLRIAVDYFSKIIYPDATAKMAQEWFEVLLNIRQVV